MNERDYYLKSDGLRYLDKTKQELNKMCFYSNGEFNVNGLLEVLEILNYEYDPELVKYSYEKEFKLGKYLRVINVPRKANIDIKPKEEKTYFISYAAYSKFTGQFDLFNTIITIDEPITVKIIESIEADLLVQIKDDCHKNSTYFATQIISINRINN